MAYNTITGLSGVQRQVDPSGYILDEKGQRILQNGMPMYIGQGGNVYTGGSQSGYIDPSGQLVEGQKPVEAPTVSNQYLNQMGAMMQPGAQFTTTDPSYQWRYQQGLDAMQRQLAQGGMNYSGGALTAAQNYGQGAASQEYQNQFNRLGTAAGLQSNVNAQNIQSQQFATQANTQAQQFAQQQAQQLQEFGVSSGLTSRSLDMQQQQQQYLNSLQQQQAQMMGLAGLWQGVSGGQGIPGAISGIGQIGSSISSGLSSLSNLFGGNTQANLSGITDVTSGSAQDIGLASQVAGTGWDMSSIFG